MKMSLVLRRAIFLFTLLYIFNLSYCDEEVQRNNGTNIPHISVHVSGIELRTYVSWPKGFIPFYINPLHYASEQTLTIMKAFSEFSFKTCLRFAPVVNMPEKEHVLVVENPDGINKCVFNKDGHNYEGPHKVVIGYDCMKTPYIEAMIMRVLGFPFEHNRAMRDIFLDIQYENIEPDSMYLFTKDHHLPVELRELPYDVNSVMHFGDRSFSKNGHRTFLFRNPKLKQFKKGLTDNDIRKVDIVYGPECLKRDREEKMEMCQNYPGVARKKRSATIERRSLRVNPDITPPPNIESINETNATDEVVHKLREFQIETEVEEIIDKVFKASSIGISHVKKSLCNTTGAKWKEPKPVFIPHNGTESEISKAVQNLVTNHIQTMINNIMNNSKEFCNETVSVDNFLRSRCNAYSPNLCPKNYRSTMYGPAMHSTQHRPRIRQSTKHRTYYRAGDAEEEPTTPITAETKQETKNETNVSRKKRDVSDKVKPHFPESLIATTENNLEIIKSIGFKNRSFGAKRLSRRRLPLHRFRVKSERKDSDSVEEKDNEDNDEITEEDDKTNKPKKYYQKYPSEKKPKVIVLSKKNKEFYDERIWTNGVIPYVITFYVQYDINRVRRELEKVNDILKNKTCVQLLEIHEEEVEKYEDYIVLNTSPDYVTGRVGGRQDFGTIELFAGGQHTQHAAMLIMAMLGFYFEISRHDRDKYIRVHVRHIRPDKLHHFEKITEDATLNLPYDYESATHPAWQFWRKVGRSGISTVATYKENDPHGKIMKSLGQNKKLLSNIDIIKINSVYGTKCMEEK